MCRSCPVLGCEALILGARDICARHFGLLCEGDQKRLDDLRPDGREVYEAFLVSMVEKIEARVRRRGAVSGLMGRSGGYPSGPVMA